MKRIGIVIAAAATLFLPAAEVAWEFDPTFDVDAQGVLVRGFRGAKVLPEGMLQLTHEWTQGAKEEPHLRSCYETFVPYDSRDLGELEIRLRARVSSTIAGAGIGLRVKLSWYKGGESEQTIRLTADNQFHLCRIDFSKFRHPEKVSRGFYLYIYPLVNLDDVEGWATVELDHLQIDFSPAGAARNILANAGEKLPDQEALIRSIAPYRLEPKGAAALLDSLKQRFRELERGTDSAKQQAAPELDREFTRLHSILSIARRWKEAKEELSRLEQTLDPKPAEERAELARIGALLANGDFPAAEEGLDQLDFGKLLAASGWQAGVSHTSTGLYGWSFRQREGLALTVSRDRVERGFFVNRDGSKSSLSILPRNIPFLEEEPEAVATDWTSADWRYRCREANGKLFDWNVAVSRLAPGALFTTNANAVRLAPQADPCDDSPIRILVPRRNGAALLTPAELAVFPWRDMSENWLLLWSDNGLPATPWLVTLQHRPERASVEENALIVHFAGQAGQLAVANLYGVRPLPPDWGKAWQKAPAEVVEQARRLNGVMTAYPWRCEETFAVDRQAAQLRVANRFEYRTAANDWNYPGTEYAPLPPVLMLAADKGYPARLPKNVADFHFAAGYGPWRAIPGNRSEYTLPLPDLAEEMFVRTERYPELQKKSRRWLRQLPDQLYHFSSGRRISISWGWAFDGFLLHTREEKEFMLNNLSRVIDRYYRETWDQLGRLRQPNFSHGHAERTEPFTGKSYLVYGWKSKHGDQLNYHDISDFAGFFLLPTLRYAQLSGDWELIRKHWRPIRELYSAMPRRAEWASMAVGSTDRSLVHAIDMAPDSWVASEAMAKLARGVGDRRTEELALLIAAKQAVALSATLWKREWDMAHNNDWDWNTQIPELGYFDASHVNSTRWEDAALASSGVFGVAYTPAVLRLYRDNCPEALRRFLYAGLEANYPQWREVGYLRPGKTTGQNGPMAFYRQLMIRNVLGEPTERLEEIRRTGLFDDNEFSIWTRPVDGRSAIVGLSLSGGAMLVGRDAPLRLADWGNAALRDAAFHFSKELALVELESREPFVLTCHSRCEPAEIRVANQTLPAEEWTYDGKLLRLRLPAGLSRVTLRYPGWTPPAGSVTAIDNTISLTPEMELCRAERDLRLAASTAKRQDFRCGPAIPIPLETKGNRPRDDSPVKAGDVVLRGVPMRLGPTVIAVGAADGLSRQVAAIPAAGKWKRLYFLHSTDRNRNAGEPVLRYRIRYEDGSEALFEAVAGRDLSGRMAQEELPNGKRALEGSNRSGQRTACRLSVWENTAWNEVAGIADFQREIKTMTAITLEFVPGEGSAALLAITGEPVEE